MRHHAAATRRFFYATLSRADEADCRVRCSYFYALADEAASLPLRDARPRALGRRIPLRRRGEFIEDDAPRRAPYFLSRHAARLPCRYERCWRAAAATPPSYFSASPTHFRHCVCRLKPRQATALATTDAFLSCALGAASLSATRRAAHGLPPPPCLMILGRLIRLPQLT